MIPLRPASRRRPTRARRCIAPIERMEDRYLLSSYQVLNTNDSGTGSLRQAILDANANPGADTITFAIPAPGPNTIRPLTPLPTISDPVTIAGSTQAGSNGRPIVEIDGSAVGGGVLYERVGHHRIQYHGARPGDQPVPALRYRCRRGDRGHDRRELHRHRRHRRFPARQFERRHPAEQRPAIHDRRPDGAAGNLISGNGGSGVVLTAFSSGLPAGNVVVGNRVGTDITGTTGLPNGGAGILVNSTGNQIGGTAPGEANVIAFNAAAGVQVGSFNFQQGVVSNPIRGNSILGNGGLGIDLGNSGVNFNSPGFHTGPNQLQNFPTLITAYPAASGGTTIEGGLDSVPNSNFTIDFYSSITPDPSGFGEGQTYLGSTTVMTGTDGHADFTATVSGTATPGMAITATTTDATNNTSEFSHFVTEAPTAQADLGIGLAAPPDPVRVGQDLTYTINVTNAGPANATGVTVTDTLPANTTFVSAMPSQGSFTVDTTAGVLTADLGTLRNGAAPRSRSWSSRP